MINGFIFWEQKSKLHMRKKRRTYPRTSFLIGDRGFGEQET
jgi:hypothetical protein